MHHVFGEQHATGLDRAIYDNDVCRSLIRNLCIGFQPLHISQSFSRHTAILNQRPDIVQHHAGHEHLLHRQLLEFLKEVNDIVGIDHAAVLSSQFQSPLRILGHELGVTGRILRRPILGLCNILGRCFCHRNGSRLLSLLGYLLTGILCLSLSFDGCSHYGLLAVGLKTFDELLGVCLLLIQATDGRVQLSDSGQTGFPEEILGGHTTGNSCLCGFTGNFTKIELRLFHCAFVSFTYA